MSGVALHTRAYSECSTAESATRRLGQCSRGAVCVFVCCGVALLARGHPIKHARTATPNLRTAVGWDRQVLQYADMTSTLPEHERSFPLGGVRGHSRDGSASVSSHVRCPLVALWRNDRIRAHCTLRHTKESRAAHAHARTRAKPSGIAACTSQSKKESQRGSSGDSCAASAEDAARAGLPRGRAVRRRVRRAHRRGLGGWAGKAAPALSARTRWCCEHSHRRAHPAGWPRGCHRRALSDARPSIAQGRWS